MVGLGFRDLGQRAYEFTGFTRVCRASRIGSLRLPWCFEPAAGAFGYLGPRCSSVFVEAELGGLGVIG